MTEGPPDKVHQQIFSERSFPCPWGQLPAGPARSRMPGVMRHTGLLHLRGPIQRAPCLSVRSGSQCATGQQPGSSRSYARVVQPSLIEASRSG